MLVPYWVKWVDDDEVEFQLNTPWWASPAVTNEGPTYVVSAAVMAVGEDHAKRIILESYEDDPDIQFISVERQFLGWSPFDETLTRRQNMIWDQRPH